jgi:hypothetical protein
MSEEVPKRMRGASAGGAPASAEASPDMACGRKVAGE